MPPLDPLRTGSYTYDLGRAWKWVTEHADASVLDAQAELAELYAVGLSRSDSDRRLLNELGALGTTWTARCGTRKSRALKQGTLRNLLRPQGVNFASAKLTPGLRAASINLPG
eukprot:COSAG01_NODE_12035_length_1810_cov_9.682057_1_plen_113_part_00